VGWWQDDDCWFVGEIVGLNRFFGKRGYERGWLMVDVCLKCCGWRKFDVGCEMIVQLRRGKFWLRVNGGWKKVG
jgi:hypothetical protein